VKLVEKLQEDMLDLKMISEDLRRQPVELKEEQNQQRIIQEANVRKTKKLELKLKQQHEETMVDQSKTNAGITAILEMMKKQQP